MGSGTQQPEEPEPTLEDEFQDLHLNVPVLKVLAHALIYNAMLDKYVESLEPDKNGPTFVQREVSAKMEDPRLFTLPCRLGDSKPFDTLANLGSCVNIIPLYLFKKLNIRLLEETDHIFGLADGTKSYPVGIVKDVEIRIGKLKLLNDFYSLQKKLVKLLLEHKALELEIERLLRAVSERPKRVPPKVVESNDLPNPVTSNSVPTINESKVMRNDKVIAPGMFRIDPRKTSREVKFVPINKVRASIRTNPITVSQPHVITLENVNSNSNGISSIGVESLLRPKTIA
ncbi:MAK10-like protein [Tanacetum coccineum]